MAETAVNVNGGALLASGAVHHEKPFSALASELSNIMGATNTGPGSVVMQFARLVAGKGRISPGDFIDLRLFDREFLAGADPRHFIGAQRFGALVHAVNYRREWIAVLSDKVASTAYLQAHGIPTIPLKAIYRRESQAGRAGVLATKAELEDFLLHGEHYPLFGKPSDNQNSIGSVALLGCEPTVREILIGGNRHASATALAEEIDANYPSGYIFQHLVEPHPAIAALCGTRLACVRMLTIIGKDGPRILRACWKVPAGANMADNYWRSGNLLAQIDKESGRVLRVTSGVGLEMREHAEHPDTHANFIGFVHPQWPAMTALALEGAALMRAVPIIGWDIACTRNGPVVVEMNEYPDAFIMQFADRRGIWDEEFDAFLKFQRSAPEAEELPISAPPAAASPR